MSDKNCFCELECPLQSAMSLIGGKWKISILCFLISHSPSRYNELKRRVNGISNTMLAKSLKELEEAGLITRKEYLEVPIRVEYSTTPLCEELMPIFTSLANWGSKLKCP